MRLVARASATYSHMVVRSRRSAAALDRLFHALTNSTRRDLVTRLLGGKAQRDMVLGTGMLTGMEASYARLEHAVLAAA